MIKPVLKRYTENDLRDVHSRPLLESLGPVNIEINNAREDKPVDDLEIVQEYN